MAQIAGIRDTVNILSNRRVYDIEKKVHLLHINQAPIYTILANMAQKRAVDTTINWHEDALLGRFTNINLTAGYGTSSTSIVVDDASIFTANDVLHVPSTGENMLITAVVVSTNTLTVTRGLGGTTAAFIADDTEVMAIGSSYTEGATAGEAVTTKVTRVYNYMQIFRAPVEITETMAAIDFRDTNDEERRLINKKREEYVLDIERAFLFGSRNETTSGGRPLRQSGGFTEFVTTNVTDNSGASITKPILNTFFRTGFEYGSPMRWLFGSSKFVEAIDNLAEGNIRTHSGEDTFGIAVKKLNTSFGEVNLVHHKELRGDTYGTYAIMMDMDAVRRVVLRPSRFKMNIQAPDADTRKHEYISEEGMEVNNEKRHSIFKNFAV